MFLIVELVLNVVGISFVGMLYEYVFLFESNVFCVLILEFGGVDDILCCFFEIIIFNKFILYEVILYVWGNMYWDYFICING